MAANMYSESREEARDYARLRNVYFEQVCPYVLFSFFSAVLVGFVIFPGLESLSLSLSL